MIVLTVSRVFVLCLCHNQHSCSHRASKRSYFAVLSRAQPFQLRLFVFSLRRAVRYSSLTFARPHMQLSTILLSPLVRVVGNHEYDGARKGPTSLSALDRSPFPRAVPGKFEFEFT